MNATIDHHKVYQSATDFFGLNGSVTMKLTREAAIEVCREAVNHGLVVVKIEGGEKRADLIRRIIDAEIPVAGHIGLTPQSVNVMGGYKVQGKTLKAVEQLMHDALALERAGACAVVVEGVPREVAGMITRELDIPTIGIGAGASCDGQVLVMHDVLGLSEAFVPRFAKPYAKLWQEAAAATASYIREVRERSFPAPQHCYGNKIA